ncbi:hypothetical protein F5X99DRAFT_381553 [Biscogniauxia marginata]|nr:hypothetical protein F5X99DRAFT_381553 [Biscogniauxia marginata]
MEQPEVEILVHIAAPSRTVDDAIYRSLASAYIDFEPINKQSLPEPVPTPIHTLPDSSIDGHLTPQLSDRLGSFKSPCASFRSVIDNANSPLLRLAGEHMLKQVGVEATQAQSTQATWQSPPSVVGDSNLQDIVAITSLSSPTRVLEHYLQGFDDSPQYHVRSFGGGEPVIISNTPVRPRETDGGRQYQTRQSPPTPAIPNTQYGNIAGELDHVGERSTKRAHGETSHLNQGLHSEDGAEDDDIIEETVILPSSQANLIARADSEPAPAKRPEQSVVEDTRQGLLRIASDTGPSTSHQSSQKSFLRIRFLSTHGFKYESLTLTAPEPPISVAKVEPRDLITPNLEKLARDLDVRKRFRPKDRTRELRPLERGYWLLDCSTWTAQLKWDAWAYLANYVGTGLAGWGVSCRRDPEYGWLRVYCWGVVVPHLYLLLYLASQREILFTGSSWVDGGGDIVIAMSTRERR